ncbi:MAG: alanine--glyoxylate aminotransferase family protein [Bacteroidia bacterium]
MDIFPTTPYLLTPGPVPIPAFVRKAMEKPVMPHRSEEFEAFYEPLLTKLRYLFQTKTGNVTTMAASGTGGVEAAMHSFFQSGEKIAVVSNGKFSKRWSDYGALLHCDVKTLTIDWGQAPDTEQVVSIAKDCKGIVLTHCETSTGVCIDLEEIALALREAYPEIIIIVDAITTVGAVPFYFDTWSIDCAIVASQKALMGPAGICAFALSEHGMKQLTSFHKSDYAHLGNHIEAARKNSYPYTPPLLQLYALEAVLAHIQHQGLPTIWNRTRRASRHFRKVLKAHKGEVFCTSASDSLSVFLFRGQEHAYLKAQWEAAGFIIAGGQEHLAGKVLRISHMGIAANTEMIDSFWENSPISLNK